MARLIRYAPPASRTLRTGDWHGRVWIARLLCAQTEAEAWGSRCHALRLSTLPAIPRAPFDRLLVAQALEERLTLVSADPQVLAYRVPFIDARR